ncbi:MAG TPA: hypothetical protein VMW24_17265 [Sedimentisphaerales bacterium]|nr:hypothetical protein [Sedimentisphaerales bacterium]
MDRQQIGVKLTIDALKLSFQIDGFMDRLIMQKAVYLAQAAGVNLGYYYHWYLHGPYSPSLTRDEFAVAMDISAGMDESKGWKLDDKSSQRLEEMRGLFAGAEADRDELAKKLELLASVHFLIDRKQASKADASRITATLRLFDKPFSEKDVMNALGELTRYDLLPA